MTHKIGLIGVLLFVGVSGIALAQTPASLQGAWRVTEITTTGAGAASNKTPQPALYVFTKQHYSILSVNGTSPRKNFAGAADPANLTNAEKLARYDAWTNFTANSGTYKVSGTTLTTSPVVAKNPGVMGTTATREFKIEGSTLILIQRSAAGGPASQTTMRLTRVE
jgi:hypothetical protein